MYAAFVKLLNMSAAAGILIAVVIALRFLLRKIPKKYICILWALVALRLIFPLGISSAVSAYNYMGNPTQSSGQIGYIQYNGKSEKPTAFVTVQVRVESEKNDGPTVVMSKKDFYIPTAMGIWAAGFAAMVFHIALSYRRVAFQVRQSIPLDRRNYRRDIFLCDDIPSPFILGMVKPKIYLPSGLDKRQQDSVIAHERAHIARLDHWWKPLGFLLLSVHWFNPLVWIGYALLCRDIEMACDEKVIAQMTPAEKQVYSTVLLTCSMPRHTITACPLAFGETGVKERIKGILNYKKPPLWIVAAASILCVTIAAIFLTNPLREGDYLILKKEKCKSIQKPQTVDFAMHTGSTIGKADISIELWQSGILSDSGSFALPLDTKQLHLSMMGKQKDDFTMESYSFELTTGKNGETFEKTVFLPEATYLSKIRPWEGDKEIPLHGGKEVLLACLVFDHGDGFFLWSFDNADYPEAKQQLQNMECVIVVRAEFQDVSTVSGPASIQFDELSFTLPKGLQYHFQGNGYLEASAGTITDGTNSVGGLRATALDLLPNEDFIGWLEAMHFPEWEMENTDYLAGGGDDRYTVTFSHFPSGGADSPDWEHEHRIFYLDGIYYDFWIDTSAVEPELQSEIWESIRLNSSAALSDEANYHLIIGMDGIDTITVVNQKTLSALGSGHALYSPSESKYLPDLDGLATLQGVEILAKDSAGNVLWSHRFNGEEQFPWEEKGWKIVKNPYRKKISTPSEIQPISQATLYLDNQEINLNIVQMEQLTAILKTAQKVDNKPHPLGDSALLQIIQKDGCYRSISIDAGKNSAFLWGEDYYQYDDAQGMLREIMQIHAIPKALAGFLNPVKMEWRDYSLICKVSAGNQMTLEQMLASGQWVQQPIPEGVTGPGKVMLGYLIEDENGNTLVIRYDSDNLCIFNRNGDCIGCYRGSYTGEEMVDMLWQWVSSQLGSGGKSLSDLQLMQMAPQGQLSVFLHPTDALTIGGMGAVTPENQSEWISAWNDVLHKTPDSGKKAGSSTYCGVLLFYEDAYLELHRDEGGFFLREMDSGKVFSAEASQPLIQLLEPMLQELRYTPVKPSELHNIRAANLVLNGMNYTLPKEKLPQLEAMLTSAKPMMGMTDCPYASLLTVTLPSGENKTVAAATDSCGYYLSNGVCYSFSGSNDGLYALFGIDLELPAETAVPPKIESVDAAEAFPMPEGYRLEMERFDLNVYRGDTQVGGILRTDLQWENLAEETVVEYLDKAMPRSGDSPYGIFAVNGRISLDWPALSAEGSRTYHTFALRQGEVYDLWLDGNLVSKEQRTEFLKKWNIPKPEMAQ